MTRQMSLPPGGSLPVRRSGVQTAPGTLGFTFRDVVRLLHRRLWWIIIITVATTGLATVICALLRHYRPLYTSEGMVICKTPVPEDLLEGYRPIPNKDLIALEIANQAAYLSNTSFLTDVLKRKEIQRTDWFKKQKDSKERLEELQGSFSAQARRGTEYVAVQMSASQAEEARTILDEILEEYKKKKLNQATEKLRNNRASLVKEQTEIENQINEKRMALDRLRQQSNIPPGWEQGRTVVEEDLYTMNRDKMVLKAQIEEANMRLEQLRQEKASQGYSSSARAAVDQDPIVMMYRNQIITHETNLDGLRGQLGTENRSVGQTQNMIESLRSQMMEREQMLMKQYSLAEEQLLIDEIELLGERFGIVAKEFEELFSTQKDLDQKLAQLQVLSEGIETLQKMQSNFDQRIYSIDVATDNTEEHVQIIFGTVPMEISFPLYTLFVPGGFVVGLLISLGLIFLLEYADDSIKTPSDVVRHLQIPMLGMIPEYDEEDKEEIELAKICSLHPRELISESFRQIRTNLYFSAPLEELKVILITSSGAGCGKTTSAVNLGITFASEGKRVLLVDANFRRAALNRLFPIEASPRGLSNVLVGQASAADVIHNTEIEGMDVIDAGPVPPNPSVLLSSERMQKFLASQRGYYDHIIIDGPPALLVTDARILAGQVDGTIMVIHAGDTSRGVIGRMLRELKTDQVRILGVLLNAVQPQKGGYFRETYRSYYDYIGHESEPERKSEPVAVAVLPETPDAIEGEGESLSTDES